MKFLNSSLLSFDFQLQSKSRLGFISNLESLDLLIASDNLSLSSSDLHVVSVDNDFSLDWDCWNLSEGDDVFLSAGVNLFGNLVFFCLIDLDESLVSVDPVSVVGTFARLVLHDDNLLSSLAAGLDDWLELSDLLFVDLDLFVQISTDSDSGSFLDSENVSFLMLSRSNSYSDHLSFLGAGIFKSALEDLDSFLGLDQFPLDLSFLLGKLDFLFQNSNLSLLDSDLVANRLASRSVQVLFGACSLSSLELDDGDLGDSLSGNVVSLCEDRNLL